MSLPNDKIPSNPTLPSTFEYFASGGLESSPLVDYELGGVALNDASQGQRVRLWKARISEGGKYLLLGAPGVPEIVKYEAPSYGALTEVSLAFDQNMRPIIGFVESEQAKHLWFDTSIEQEVITVLAADVKNPKVSLDEKRPDFGTTNDVILSYLRGQDLYVRVGRDRYTVEYLIQSAIPEGYELWKTGMNLGLRFQWEFRKAWDAETGLDHYLANAADPGTDITPAEQPPSTTIPGLDS